ncbi:unnamed protein product [Arabis nemorensis]|uniref:DUF287 domain-containing protein n=1 Tax=Arabis nemorensis TaxID=586526 RepID=A0A565AUS2_9BRAS|nr:unnamed protein product [Arabis nemorensis]
MGKLFAKFDGFVTRDQWVYLSFTILLEEIENILVSTSGERALCDEIFDEAENDRDADDYIVQSWKNRYFIDKKPVFLPFMYDRDVHAQVAAAEKEAAEKEADNVEEEPQLVSNDEVEKLKKDIYKAKTWNDSRFDHVYCSGGGGTTGVGGGTTGGMMVQLVATPNDGGHGVETPNNVQPEPVEEFESCDEGSKDCEGEGSKDCEGEGSKDKEGEGGKDEVVGQKRTRKPSNAKKSPFTTMTEEKKRKKAKSKKG